MFHVKHWVLVYVGGDRYHVSTVTPGARIKKFHVKHKHLEER